MLILTTAALALTALALFCALPFALAMLARLIVSTFTDRR